MFHGAIRRFESSRFDVLSAFLLTFVFACPYGIENYLGLNTLAAPPIVILFAFGMACMSLALVCGFRLFDGIGGVGFRRAAGAALALFCLASAPSWIAAVCFDDVVAARGYYGSNIFVDIKNVTSFALSLLAMPAGVAAVVLLAPVGRKSAQTEGVDVETSLGCAAARCKGAKAERVAWIVVFAASILARQVSAWLFVCTSLYAPVAVLFAACASGVSVICCLMVSKASGKRLRIVLWYALGVVIWGAFVRVISLDVLAAPWALLTSAGVLTAGIALLCMMRARCERDVVDAGDDDRRERFLMKRFTEVGLAPRECEIACLTACGSSSREAAEALGIKPPTARSALQRSYKKLGVEGYDEFMAMFGGGGSKVAGESHRIGEPSARSPHTLKVLRDALGRMARRFPLSVRAGVLVAVIAALTVFPVLLLRNPERWGSTRIVLYLVSIAALVSGLFSCCAMASEAVAVAPGGERRDASASVTMVALAAFLGFAWEELQRNLGGYPLPDLTAPFEVVLVVLMLLLTWKLGASRRHICIAAALALVGMVLLGRVFIWVLALYATVMLMAFGMRLTMIDALVPLLSIAMFGLSAIASDVIVNTYADMRWGNDAYTIPFGGHEAFSMFVAALIVVLLGVITLAAAIMCRDMVWKRRFDALSHADGSLRARMRHALLARGMSETEADVLVCIARGMGAAEICKELCFARGTVNAARNAGYRTLGIHDREALLRTLSQHTGL